jgi:hypothetical protein
MDKDTNIIKIKIVSDTPGRPKSSSEFTAKYWYNTFIRQSQGLNEWDNIKLVIGDTEKADYYLIINHPYIPGSEGSLYNSKWDFYEPSKAIIMLIEPTEVIDGKWDIWSNPQDDDYLKVLSPSVTRMPAWWEIDVPYDRLKNGPLFEKTKVLSAAITGKTYYEGHRLRVKFFEDYLNGMDNFDLWGRAAPAPLAELTDLEKERYGGAELILNSKNYKGEMPIRNKNQALLPYEYHFACENSQHKNYFTEKIIDSILADCLTFYWGCPNLSDYIPKESFINLPLDTDMKRSHDIITSTIKNNERADRLPYIQKAKEIIINELNLFPTIHKIINKHHGN